jgi:prepilin-type N-terminal cleavage/methylation domain-containing protein
MNRIKLNKKGFTLLELMIATVVFSTILLATTTVLIQLGRMYYKGVIISRTQEVTRNVADEISQQLQFGSSGVVHNDEGTMYGTLQVKAFCIGSQRYSYVINAKVSSGAETRNEPPNNIPGNRLQHALWRDTIDPTVGKTCPALNLSEPNPGGTDGQELLGQNMRLSPNFKVPSCNDTTNICSFTIAVLHGDNDLLSPPDGENPVSCGNVVGSQWCASSTISTQVFKRLRTGS